ncbi:tRNA uridine-5-carboxymethylaminomethyl(34) synthesis GTPase MnmE [Sulfuriferula sp. AH1]|uniref:tRNA uridine-5-carboxymethylaminomethyl(34) synthesis GTPase MnmE n=1 Tax=Sulfuriferula sp. AH1 TaxID=1985873 RepID=UPI000B3B96FD|nr:tRNA uridine-5-carboxymethylaminomethyl(34) synthesis GTPase MnmE [Sulfuriferula sp. AH1]ARU32763.1 tRNA uridine-5-carboxymethylaminomethyl(34) synthesis GTPase MnmE [Sulfuriferula sp. AH1]
MPNADHDTIAAIATAPGRGGIGIVRISGAHLIPFAQQVTGITPKPRFAHFVPILDADGSVLDEGVVLYFPAPHSFTGDDVLELQGHGGPVVLNLVLNRCLQLGARLANPGEFTQRAFLNDKLDLTQAESVADLIDASSAEAARSAMRSLTGEFSARIHALVASLIDLRMLVEATLDFPEEELEFLQAAKAFERLAQIKQQVTDVEQSARQGSLLRDGIRVVLIGQPNVGKSSLLNQLAGQEVAIVTAIAGTTRDTVRETIQIEGVPVHVIDTAGLRDTDDEVERIGIERTWEAVSRANVALLLVDAQYGVTSAEQNIIAKLPAGLPLFTVHNKIDLTQELAGESAREIYVSAKTGVGIPLLRAALLKIAGWQTESGSVFLARERHLNAIREAKHHLIQASELPVSALEFLAEELRLAQNALSSVTGVFSADDLLGEIFSRFCIGK